MTVSIYGLFTRRVVPNLPSIVREDLCLLKPPSFSEMSLEVSNLIALQLWGWGERGRGGRSRKSHAQGAVCIPAPGRTWAWSLRALCSLSLAHPKMGCWEGEASSSTQRAWHGAQHIVSAQQTSHALITKVGAAEGSAGVSRVGGQLNAERGTE